MTTKEIEESKKITSKTRIRSWGKMILCVLVVGWGIAFDWFSADYVSYSFSNSYSPGRENAIECKRFFPDSYATIALNKRYPSCYRKPQSF